MPIKGFACPYGQGEVSFAQCLDHSRTGPPKCGLTYPILGGIVGN